MNKARESGLQDCAVMVVEDEFFQAADLASARGMAGARLVGPFATVEAALAALGRGVHVDVAILDTNLRGSAVTPVITALSLRAVPYVLATGYDRDMLPADWQAAPIFQKPFEISSLLEVIAGLCHRTRRKGKANGTNGTGFPGRPTVSAPRFK